MEPRTFRSAGLAQLPSPEDDNVENRTFFSGKTAAACTTPRRSAISYLIFIRLFLTRFLVNRMPSELRAVFLQLQTFGSARLFGSAVIPRRTPYIRARHIRVPFQMPLLIFSRGHNLQFLIAGMRRVKAQSALNQRSRVEIIDPLDRDRRPSGVMFYRNSSAALPESW